MSWFSLTTVPLTQLCNMEHQGKGHMQDCTSTETQSHPRVPRALVLPLHGLEDMMKCHQGCLSKSHGTGILLEVNPTIAETPQSRILW